MCNEYSRIKAVDKNIEPIITWRPWNPVAKKNVDPNTLSAIENEVSLYSFNCRSEK